MNIQKLKLLLATACLAPLPLIAQITERERPAEWKHLITGGRYMDRFEAMPEGTLSGETWGADSVRPRYIDNGIEHPDISFWGGNILQTPDRKYHLFVCGWPESAPKGHMEWPNSTVYHATGDRLHGPFTIQDTIGKGHNPEAFVLNDGRIVVYVIDGYYIADQVNGPWQYGKFTFNPRDRKIIEGLSNLSFAKRQDGSYLMVCRGGGIWISKDGIAPYEQITDKRVYPPVKGEFEDPVIWRGPVISGVVQQFWTDVLWNCDYLFVDMPPGTGDVSLSVFQSIPLDGIVIVASPQELVSMVVEKAVKMAEMMEVPIVGLVENMSYVACPDCGKQIHLFGQGKTAEAAERHHLPVLAEMPIDPALAALTDAGDIESFQGSWLEAAADKLEGK